MDLLQIPKINVTKYPVLTEKYPHIIKQLELFWGYKEIYSYIDSLILQEREKNREGFEFKVLLEFSEIQEFHQRWIQKPKSKDRWETLYVHTRK